jgi:hypothetical protein
MSIQSSKQSVIGQYQSVFLNKSAFLDLILVYFNYKEIIKFIQEDSAKE